MTNPVQCYKDSKTDSHRLRKQALHVLVVCQSEDNGVSCKWLYRTNNIITQAHNPGCSQWHKARDLGEREVKQHLEYHVESTVVTNIFVVKVNNFQLSKNQKVITCFFLMQNK